MTKLVRHFDYITGRLNGQISQPAHDPWAYRRYKRKDNNYNRLDNHKLQINTSFIKQNYLRWNSSTQAASAVVHEGNCQNKNKDTGIRIQMITYIAHHTYLELQIECPS